MLPSNAVVFEPSKCNGCALCVQNCPEMVFEQRGEKQPPLVAHPDRCIGCLSCEEDCTRGALRVHRLAAGMNLQEVPEPALGLSADTLYDLIVVGAGPAGLGAAIRGRLLGLKVAVIERLPSPRRSHHPDGGLLFTDKDLYTLQASSQGLYIRELDVVLPSKDLRPGVHDFRLMGPSGRITKAAPDPGRAFHVMPKDRLIELLIDRARELGAAIAFNTRAHKVHRPSGSDSTQVTVDGGLVLAAKVVISAEGTSGKLASRAGIPVNAHRVGWGYALLIEQAPVPKAPGEAGFMVGQLDGLREHVPFLSFWCTGSSLAEIAVGPIQTKKARLLEQPLDSYLTHALTTDRRISGRLGQDIAGRPQTHRDGCRMLARRLPERAVSDGVIAVGDAIACCGMMTSIAALKSGDLAAEVAQQAIAQGDTSAKGLRDYERRVFNIGMVKGMSWLHALLVEAPIRLSRPDLETLFARLEHLRLGKMMRGGSGALWEMSTFMLGSAMMMMRRPDLRPYLTGSGLPALSKEVGEG